MGPTVFDFDRNEHRECEVQERNGNLVYVEYLDGSTEWVDHQSVENRDW